MSHNNCPREKCKNNGGTKVKVVRPVPLSSIIGRPTSHGHLSNQEHTKHQQQHQQQHVRASSWSSSDTTSGGAFQSIGSSFSKPATLIAGGTTSCQTSSCTNPPHSHISKSTSTTSSYRGTMGTTTPILNSQNIHGGRFSMYEYKDRYTGTSNDKINSTTCNGGGTSPTLIPVSSNSSLVTTHTCSIPTTSKSNEQTHQHQQPSMPTFLQSNFQPPSTSLIRVSPFEPIVHDRKLWSMTTTAATTTTRPRTTPSTTTTTSCPTTTTATSTTCEKSQVGEIQGQQYQYKRVPSSRSISPLCGEEYKAWTEQRQLQQRLFFSTMEDQEDSYLLSTSKEEEEELEGHYQDNEQEVIQTEEQDYGDKEKEEQGEEEDSFLHTQTIVTTTTTNTSTTAPNNNKDNKQEKEECQRFRPVSVSPPIPQEEELVQLRSENEALKQRMRLLEKALMVQQRHTTTPSSEKRMTALLQDGELLKDDFDDADLNLQDNISRLGQMSVSIDGSSTPTNSTTCVRARRSRTNSSNHEIEEEVLSREKKRRRTDDDTNQ